MHQLGQAWAQIARNPGGATGAIAPHIGAVVVARVAGRTRTPTDVLPGFIALNSGGIPASGYLSGDVRAVRRDAGGDRPADARASRRRDALHRPLEPPPARSTPNRTSGALGKNVART